MTTLVKTLISFLGYQPQLSQYHIGAVIPPNPPDKMIIIQQTGETVNNGINNTSIIIETYDDTLLDAENTSNLVRWLLARINVNDVALVKQTMSYNFTDTTKKKPRWLAQYTVYNTVNSVYDDDLYTA